MRKVSLALLILLALPISMRAQEPAQSPLQGVIMGSMWNDDGFSHPVDLGAKAGVVIPVDSDKGFSLRTTFSKWSLRDEQSATAVTNTFIIDWYVGKKWTFYTTLLGAETYVAGPLSGTDFFTGAGVSRRIMTADQSGYRVPFYMDVFADVSLSKTADWKTDSGEDIGDYIQINVGVKFGRPVK